MTTPYTNDYLLDKKIKIFQPVDGYRASSDAVLLSAFVSNITKGKILDVGSGTGAVSLCLAQRMTDSSVQIVGLEIQSELAELSNFSAQQNNFRNLKYLNKDIKLGCSENNLEPCSYDIVVTNPPYSENDLPSPNKSKASAHNHIHFDLNHWLLFCLKMTKPFGKIYMVHRAEALPKICSILQNKAGNIQILPVYSKNKQNAKRVLVSAQKDSKAPSRLLSPFITHNEYGSYTDKAQEILRQGKIFSDILNF